MLDLPTPRQILEVLLPQLRIAGAYACEIQSRIADHPAKDAENFFGAALSDADLSVQTFIEVAMLGLFPQVRFFGEEHEQTYNTKYFRGITLGDRDDYLVTLDPIDGTRFYLDGHNNFQIILSVLNRDDYEAAIAITPAQNCYHYALRGQGTFKGNLQDSLEDCQPLQIEQPDHRVFLGFNMAYMAAALKDQYEVISISTDYSTEHTIPSVNGLLTGEIAGVALAKGNFIDGAALAFMAREMGYIASNFAGEPLPPLHTSQNFQMPGLLVAASEKIHQDLVRAVNHDGVREAR